MRSTSTLNLFMITAACLGLAACSSNKAPDLAPVAPVAPIATPSMEPLPVGPLTAPSISKALSERKFTYAAPGRKGTVTYYKDGTFEYDEAGKGTGTGIWQPAEGKLCEARNPTSFLPKGTPSTCVPITSDGSKLTAGAMQLIPL